MSQWCHSSRCNVFVALPLPVIEINMYTNTLKLGHDLVITTRINDLGNHIESYMGNKTLLSITLNFILMYISQYCY